MHSPVYKALVMYTERIWYQVFVSQIRKGLNMPQQDLGQNLCLYSPVRNFPSSSGTLAIPPSWNSHVNILQRQH